MPSCNGMRVVGQITSNESWALSPAAFHNSSRICSKTSRIKLNIIKTMHHSIATICSGWATSQQSISKHVTIRSKVPDHQLVPVKYQTMRQRVSRGPNTFSSSPTGLDGFSGIVRVLPYGHSTTLRGADYTPCNGRSYLYAFHCCPWVNDSEPWPVDCRSPCCHVTERGISLFW